MDKKITSAVLVFVGIVGFYFFKQKSQGAVTRVPSSVSKPIDKLKKSLAPELPASEAVGPTVSKSTAIDMKQFDRHDITESDVRKEFEARGYDILSIRKDPVYGYRVQAQAKSVSEAQVVQEMRDQWENNQDKVLAGLNGRAIELTDEDRAAIDKLKAQMPGL